MVSEEESFRSFQLPHRPKDEDKNRETWKAEAVARMQPSFSEDGKVTGIFMTVSQSSSITPYYAEDEDDDSESLSEDEDSPSRRGI